MNEELQRHIGLVISIQTVTGVVYEGILINVCTLVKNSFIVIKTEKEIRIATHHIVSFSLL